MDFVTTTHLPEVTTSVSNGSTRAKWRIGMDLFRTMLSMIVCTGLMGYFFVHLLYALKDKSWFKALGSSLLLVIFIFWFIDLQNSFKQLVKEYQE